MEATHASKWKKKGWQLLLPEDPGSNKQAQTSNIRNMPQKAIWKLIYQGKRINTRPAQDAHAAVLFEFGEEGHQPLCID